MPYSRLPQAPSSQASSVDGFLPRRRPQDRMANWRMAVNSGEAVFKVPTFAAWFGVSNLRGLRMLQRLA